MSPACRGCLGDMGPRWCPGVPKITCWCTNHNYGNVLIGLRDGDYRSADNDNDNDDDDDNSSNKIEIRTDNNDAIVIKMHGNNNDISIIIITTERTRCMTT